MKLIGRREKIIFAIAFIGGILLSVYIIYEQKQDFGIKETFSVGISFLISLIVIIILIKKANK